MCKNGINLKYMHKKRKQISENLVLVGGITTSS